MMRPARTLLSGLALTILTSAALASTEPDGAQAGAAKPEDAVLTAPVSETTDAATETGQESNSDQSSTEPASIAAEPAAGPAPEPAATASDDEPAKPSSEQATTTESNPVTTEPATALTESPATPADPAAVAVEAPAAPAGTATAEAVPEESKFKPELLRLISEAKAISDGDREALTAFYDQRGDDLLWMDGSAFSGRAEAVMTEIRNAEDWGLEASAFELPSVPRSDEPGQVADAELKLTLAVLKYASHARGGRMDPKQLSNYIDREPPLLPAADVLSGIAAAETADGYLRGLHPQHPQFEKLRQAYLALKRNLPLTEAAGEEVARKPAAKSKEDGKGPSQQATMRKLLHNMEQWRWMPEDLGQFYVWANVPEFTLRVMKDGEPIFTERLIAGKRDTQTPIFSDEMETVVLHPFWGVPDSIKVKELLPGLVRGSNVLARNDLRIQYRGRDIDPASVDWTRTDIRNFHVYQPPGGSNVLGQVKFLFPNEHQVYMHDTPTKNLFSASQRTFSHGCMRVRNPLRFAEILLAHDKGWDEGRVTSLVKSGPRNNHIKLDTKIPVHITYFTAWVDDEGKLKTWPDVYGHEQRIQMGLEGKAHLIARSKENLGTVRAEVVGRLAETKPTWSPSSSSMPDWARRVFGN